MLRTRLDAFDDHLYVQSVECSATKGPWPVWKWMNGVDLASYGCQSECLGADIEKRRRPRQIEPRLNSVWRGAINRDLVVGSECSDALARPAIAVARGQLVPVENTGDEIVVGEQHQGSDCSEDIVRGTVALSTATLRQAQFGVDAAHPMNEKHNLSGFGIDVCDHLSDDSADNAFLESRVRRRG